MSIPMTSMRFPPYLAARALEVGLSVAILGWVFRGAVEFAFWTLEFVWL